MAHKKGVGSSRNGRDSQSKRLGIKESGGSFVIAGNIIARQRGTKFHAGNNVGLGKDYTIYSLIDGIVAFEQFSKTKKRISVYPLVEIETEEIAEAWQNFFLSSLKL